MPGGGAIAVPIHAGDRLRLVDVEGMQACTEVEVGKLDGHQKRLPARIVRFPHYDPEKTRVRA